MRSRHRLALLCMVAALAIFYAGERLQPRWIWSAGYWLCLAIGLVVLLRRGGGRRPRPR